MLTPIKRTYSNLAGVDFSNDPSKVQINRSPDCTNMWKNYSSTQGACVETRPGIVQLENFTDSINGIHIYDIGTRKAIVHAGTKLIEWNSFPSSGYVVLKTDMNNQKSSMVVFQDKLYINDGSNYLVYDGNILKDVSEDAFVPTTTISRLPTGGGIVYQAVNVLTGKRRNSFVADGESTNYYLDTVMLEENGTVKAWVNDVEVNNFTVNRALGRITFDTAPVAPSTAGQDNVIIEFEKIGTDYNTRISNCTLSLTFDNRIFFAGNPQFKNAIFHCELKNPAYVSDLAYYQDGTSDSMIKSMTVGNNLLWVFKETSQQNDTIFYHVPTIDSEAGKIYPSKQGNISTGCVSQCTNFNDDIVFVSKQGLEGIGTDISQEQILSHRSSLIDAKFVNENNYEDLQLCEWRGYLLCLVDGNIYLADSRQKFQGINGYEYEWFYWKISQSIGKIVFLKEYKGVLYAGTDIGNVCQFDGTNDNGDVIYSCWTMPNDFFENENHLKTTNKRGGIAKIKTIPNGLLKVSVATDKKDEKLITTYSATGFDFNNIDFSNFAFTTKNNSYVVYKIKQKKFIELCIKFFSDELDKPFGLYDSVIEAYIGSYIKR